MVFSGDVRVVLHVRGSVFTVCVLLRLLVSVPVQASLNVTLEEALRREELDIQSSFLFRGDWDYGKNHGPDHWPGYCNTGKKQSPVNLVEDDSVSGHAEHLAFFNYENPAPVKFVNNGHSVSGQITEKCPRAVGAGKLPGLYYLDSFHFHWKSEHTNKKKQYPLELHLVHVKEKYKTVDEARSDPSGLAVIGVFFEETGSENTALTPLLEAVKKVGPGGDVSAEVADFNLESLLPNSDKFFRYQGSLTTPDCDEIVVWTVLKDTVHISASQVRVFREVKDSHKSTLLQNFRPVQPLNDRTVYTYRSGTSRTITRGTTASLLVALTLHV